MNRLDHLLSKRERQVMQGIAAGLKPGEIADIMRLSKKSVWTYATRVRKKLRAANSVHAAVLWTRGEVAAPKQVRELAAAIVRMATAIAVNEARKAG